jgi:hypothetical protein
MFTWQSSIGKPLQITPHLLTKHVNEVLLPKLRPDSPIDKNCITERTAQRWLWKLGYRNMESRKGAYMDGHERPDVIAYRKVFIDYMSHEKGIGR